MTRKRRRITTPRFRWKCQKCGNVHRTHADTCPRGCSCGSQLFVRMPSEVLAKGWKQYTMWFGRNIA